MNNLNSPLMYYAICCDFDGTITLMDTGKALLTELTDKDWHYYDDLVIEGKIGTREALVNQWGMIDNTSMKEINSIVDEIQIDPSFIEFYNWIKEIGLKFTIVSDGFVTYIERILSNSEISNEEFEIKANDMKLVNGKIELVFLTQQCNHGCANCKFSHVKLLKDTGLKIIYIGDGLSDIFPAKNLADIIFARKDEDLAKELEKDSRLIVFSDFSDIKKELEEIIHTT